MKYPEERNKFLQEKMQLLEDWNKTYALIYGTFCTREMKTVITEYPVLIEKVRDNPIELLKAISVIYNAQEATVNSSADVRMNKYDEDVTI